MACLFTYSLVHSWFRTEVLTPDVFKACLVWPVLTFLLLSLVLSGFFTPVQFSEFTFTDASPPRPGPFCLAVLLAGFPVLSFLTFSLISCVNVSFMIAHILLFAGENCSWPPCSCSRHISFKLPSISASFFVCALVFSCSLWTPCTSWSHLCHHTTRQRPWPLELLKAGWVPQG